MTALVLFIVASLGFIAGDVFRAWREGLGPFSPRIQHTDDTLRHLSRALSMERHPSARQAERPRLRAVR